MEKILLDTDIGGDIDDAICLAYLLREPQCDLLGITTVCGEAEKRAAVADAICRAAGRDVPVVAGMDTTLQPIPLYPTPDGAAALDHWPHRSYAPGDAPAFLYQKIREHPHEITLIGIGNMTNIATLFTAHPDAPGLLKGLAMMNGYFGADPLPDPTYNWNSWADPEASRIVYDTAVANHRSVPLEITGTLTIEAKRAGELLAADSGLMRAVFDFGNAWLESAGVLTLHDPLAAVSVFHPELCRFERGTVRVETVQERDMGGTAFTPCPDGSAEIARSVDREAFYRILSATLCGSVPPLVRKRAEAAGAVGKAWLAGLDALIAKLESQWHITVGAPLAGGTHAYVARAKGWDGNGYVLKIDMPESMGHGSFSNSITAMELVGGRGYAKLYAYDEEARACLLEELGPPLKELHYPVERQIEIICGALEQSWQALVPDASLPTGDDSIAWFRDFLGSTWEQLRRPCPERVLRQAMEFLRIREARKNPASYVLLHGDAHSANTLQELSSPGRFKLVDPDGIFYEKAYDLGVLMREWPEEYRDNPVGSGRKRCQTLRRLTGVDEDAIWQWGFLQTVSTGFVLLQIGQEDAGKTLLNLAEAWCCES